MTFEELEDKLTSKHEAEIEALNERCCENCKFWKEDKSTYQHGVCGKSVFVITKKDFGCNLWKEK